jgi:1-deoxy-D-xylulose-5-phosphate synthase
MNTDVKNMSKEELEELVPEIRDLLINTVSKNGGHLGPNLGVIELTIALHRVFNSPEDKFFWDVGHQSYVHKILTGREDRFDTIRKKDGLGPFTSREESEHDHFVSGHAGNALSAALGTAMGDKENNCIAIVGDASIANGVSLEAINHIASLKPENLIVVLNDNEMSIGENVGMFSRGFRKIMNTTLYNEIKVDVEHAIRKGVVGNHMANLISRIEKSVKGFVSPSSTLETFGFDYIGPVDGHNLPLLIEKFKMAKNHKKPVFIHVKTIKGRGYKYAEENMEKFHGIAPFDIATGETGCSSKSYSQNIGEKLEELASKDKDLIAISAAMVKGTGLSNFFKAYKDQAYDTGIAEEHAVIFGTALALTGKKVFVNIYSTFLQRAYDQLIHDVSIQKAPVKFILDRAGIVGEDGKTHQGIFDINYLLTVPNMVIAAPTTSKELKEAVELAYNYDKGPMAIRISKGSCFDIENSKPLEFGKWHEYKKGSKELIIATGSMFEEVLKVEGHLGDATIVAAPFIAPLDEEYILDNFKDYEKISILEEGVIKGGFGTSILEFMNENQIYKGINRVGLQQGFVPHGTRDELMKEYGLRGDKLVEAIKKEGR